MYVGRIEETNEGKDCSYPYTRYKKKGFPYRRYIDNISKAIRVSRYTRYVYDGKDYK